VTREDGPIAVRSPKAGVQVRILLGAHRLTRPIGHLTRRNAQCQCSIMTGQVRLAAPNACASYAVLCQIRAQLLGPGRRMYRVESIYRSSEHPRLQLASESDLLAALAAELLEENHFLDLKRKVAAGKVRTRRRPATSPSSLLMAAR
jgi:hypothetical protein